MMQRKLPATLKNEELAKMLGISEELASSCLATGHITLTNDTRQTFVRLRDFYQILRRTSGGRGYRATA